MNPDHRPLPCYDPSKSYEWNYSHAPDPPATHPSPVPGSWTYCGLPVDSPLGIPAGPLLNGRWLLYYAALGFDVLTYKTVRRVSHPCYPLPNLQPIELESQLTAPADRVPTSPEMTGSWAVSFGMPSKAPDEWRADVEWTKGQLPKGKILAVSVVATVADGATLDEMANDYAQCARWAVDAGADVIETNFSCPNVATCDGQLYQQSESAGVVAARVRDAIGKTPYVIKVGRIENPVDAEALIDAVGGSVNGIATTNSIAATVIDARGKLLFDGARRGICGAATREASTEQVAALHRIVADRHLPCSIIGVGGASSALDVIQYLRAGAESVHIATAAMVNPSVGLDLRRELPKLLPAAAHQI